MSPRRCLPLLALVVVAALPASATAKAIPAGFYSAASVPSSHGKLIKSLRIRGAALPAAGRSYAVLYSSQAPSGEEVPASGVVTIPGGRAPKGGFPVISWAHGTTGIADGCAPSHFLTGAPRGDYGRRFKSMTTHWVREGFAVAQADYQGLGTAGLHQYLIGQAEGRSVIDIVSAARGLSDKVGRRWATIGHSQGGHAVLWAAALAADYAPALTLEGAVPLAPASHIGEQAALIEKIDGNPFGGLPALIVAGAVENAGLAPATVFTDAAMALYPQVDQVCLDKLSEDTSFGGLSLKEHFRAGAERDQVIALISANDPEDLDIPGVPLLIAQGKQDTTVFPTYTDQTVADYQSRGMDVTYKTYDNTTHTTVPWSARKDADRFLDRVLG